MLRKKRSCSTPIRHIDIKQPHVVRSGRRHALHGLTARRDLARAAPSTSACSAIRTASGHPLPRRLAHFRRPQARCFRRPHPQQHGRRRQFRPAANIVDQDFFEALGFKHYIADELYKSGTQDGELRELMIDRIYDTLIDEEELRHCDETTEKVADSLPPRPHSSREFIPRHGRLARAKRQKPLRRRGVDSIVFSAYQKDVPIFFARPSATVPPVLAFIAHQHKRQDKPKVSIDSVKGLLRAHPAEDRQSHDRAADDRGGVPKNFAQDIVVAADILGNEAPMHKYAIQITVADVPRTEPVSSSTAEGSQLLGARSTPLSSRWSTAKPPSR